MASIETRKSAKGITYRVKIRLEGKPPVTRTFTRLLAVAPTFRHHSSTVLG